MFIVFFSCYVNGLFYEKNLIGKSFWYRVVGIIKYFNLFCFIGILEKLN